MRLVLTAWFVVCGVPGLAQKSSAVDLTQMNLQDLMNVKVTSVSKSEQRLSHAAAAVFVIGREDIRRSGAANLPDLLRMAPGVDVAQIDANAWAISIRGFSTRYSNKVLVLIDGRTVYSPSFSGVFWDHLDMPLENIERIEIIRGPGGSVWGSNAVNGVINIITRSSKDTKGGLLTAAGGSQLRGLGTVQYGGQAGGTGTYRVFASYFDVGNGGGSESLPAQDHWMRSHAGFRSDWDLSDRDSLTVQGDLFSNEESQIRHTSFIASAFEKPLQEDVDATGGNLLARWTHTLAGGSQATLQTYYDTYRRTDLGSPEVLRTYDIDFQHHLNIGPRNDVVWGFGYRSNTTKLAPGYEVGLILPSPTTSLFSMFLQDEFQLSESLWITGSYRLEHNAYTGFQSEPGVKLAWNRPDSRITVWGAASRALRQPASTDVGIRAQLGYFPLDANTVQILQLQGNPHIRDEEIRDVEIGYRQQFTKTLSLDVATFLSFYRHLETYDPGPAEIMPGAPVRVLIPYVYQNKSSATDYGGEISLNWKASSRWRITPGYSYLHADIRQDADSYGFPTATVATDFPQHKLHIRSAINLSSRTEFDQSLDYTARLPGGAVPGHARLDLRVARRMGETVEISLVGQNLLNARTTEYGGSTGMVGTQSVRNVFGKITWKF